MTSDLPPYPEYKDSGDAWLGKMPTHWGTTGLGAISLRRSERNRLDLPLLSVLREKGVVLRSSLAVEENHNFIPDDLSNYRVARAGDLVVNKMKAWQGSVGIAPTDGIVSPAYFVFALSGITKEYAHRLLRCRLYADYFARASDGIRIGQWDLSIDQMKRIPVVIPPIEEQGAIVRYLDVMDRRIRRFIRNRRRLIEVLNEQKQAIINRAVTCGLDPTAPLKPSGIDWLGDIPQHWEMVPLRHIGRVQTGITLGKYYDTQSRVERPYLRVANVQAGRLDLRVIKTVEVPPAEASACELRPGDVLMTEGGDIDKLGRGCVWNGEIEECLHQNHIYAVRVDKSRLHPGYLTALMASKHGRTYFQINAKQTTNLATTNSSKMRAFMLPLPPLNEQAQLLEAIRGEVETTAVLRDRAQREIDLIREYRARLIADVVTGKVDVRGIEVPEVAEEELPTLDEDNGESDDVIGDEPELEVEK
jgi:type I restriction enzyme S subunit